MNYFLILADPVVINKPEIRNSAGANRRKFLFQCSSLLQRCPLGCSCSIDYSLRNQPVTCGWGPLDCLLLLYNLLILSSEDGACPLHQHDSRRHSNNLQAAGQQKGRPANNSCQQVAGPRNVPGKQAMPVVLGGGRWQT